MFVTAVSGAWCDGNTVFAPPPDETTIADGKYCDCWTVTRIEILYAIEIGTNCFLNLSKCTCVIIGDSVESIGWYAFDIESNATIQIGKNLRHVGNYAMRGYQLIIDPQHSYLKMDETCHGLYYVQSGQLIWATDIPNDWKIPPYITSFGNEATSSSATGNVTFHENFRNIPRLSCPAANYYHGPIGGQYEIIGNQLIVKDGELIRLALSVKSLNCTALGLTSIAEFACFSSTQLESIEFSDTMTFSWGEISYCRCLKAVILPNGCQTISRRFCLNCFALEAIANLEKVENIGSTAFQYCSQLKTVSLPSIRKIDSQVFYGCSRIKVVELGPNLESLGNEVFRGCTSLERIDLDPDCATFYVDDVCHGLVRSNEKSLVVVPSLNISETLLIPEKISVIEGYAIRSNVLKEMTVEGSPSVTGAWVTSCPSLARLTITSSLKGPVSGSINGCAKFRLVKIGCFIDETPYRTIVSGRAVKVRHVCRMSEGFTWMKKNPLRGGILIIILKVGILIMLI